MKKIFALLLFLATSSVSFSQDADKTINISLEITASEIIESELSSLVSRKFREINDVKIVDPSSSSYTVNVLTTESNSTKGFRTGFVTSILVEKNFDSQRLVRIIGNLMLIHKSSVTNPLSSEERDSIKQEINYRFGNMMKSQLEEAVKNELHVVLIDPEIESLTNRIVAEVDHEIFEQIRQKNQ